MHGSSRRTGRCPRTRRRWRRRARARRPAPGRHHRRTWRRRSGPRPGAPPPPRRPVAEPRARPAPTAVPAARRRLGPRGWRPPAARRAAPSGRRAACVDGDPAQQRDAAPAQDRRLVSVEVDQERGVLVDPEHEGVGRELLLQLLEPLEAEVAEPRVVVAALGVVEVGDDGHGQPEAGQQVEALQPERVRAHLVDLVHGHGGDAECQGGRAGRPAPCSVSFRASIRHGRPRHWRRANDGLPGPVKSQSAAPMWARRARARRARWCLCGAVPRP